MKKIILIISLILVTSTTVVCGYFFVAYPIRYKKLITQISEKYSISPSLVASMINVESSYNAIAKSNAGAIGLMQIMPNTCKYVCDIYGLTYDVDNMYLPEYNIEIGCLYLKYLQTKFDDTDTVLCAYNAGETTIRSWLNNDEYSENNKLKYIPYKETKNYIKKINKNIKIYKKIYKK